MNILNQPTTSTPGSIKFEIQADGPVRDLSLAFNAIEKAAVTISDAVQQITVNLSRTLQLIDDQVLQLSDRYGHVGTNLEEKTSQIPGSWLWITLFVITLLALLTLILCLVCRTKTEYHKHPKSTRLHVRLGRRRKKRKLSRVADYSTGNDVPKIVQVADVFGDPETPPKICIDPPSNGSQQPPDPVSNTPPNQPRRVIVDGTARYRVPSQGYESPRQRRPSPLPPPNYNAQYFPPHVPSYLHPSELSPRDMNKSLNESMTTIV